MHSEGQLRKNTRLPIANSTHIHLTVRVAYPHQLRTQRVLACMCHVTVSCGSRASPTVSSVEDCAAVRAATHHDHIVLAARRSYSSLFAYATTARHFDVVHAQACGLSAALVVVCPIPALAASWPGADPAPAPPPAMLSAVQRVLVYAVLMCGQ